MIRRSTWTRGLLLMLLLAVSAVSLGDEGKSHGGSATPKADEPARSTSDPDQDLMKWFYTVLDKHFSIPEAAAKKKFEARLPKGVGDVQKESDKKEETIAGVIADVWGTINDAQAKAMLEWALATKGTLEEAIKKAGKDVDPASLKKLEVIKRLLWAGKILKNDDPDFKELMAKVKDDAPQFKPFKTAFDPEWERVKEKNKRYHALLADAQSSDAKKAEEAKAQLGTGFLGTGKFIAGQAESKNDGLVNEFVKGASNEIAGGERAVDFLGADGKPTRLVLGKDPAKYADLVREGLKQETGLLGMELSPKKLDTVENTVRPNSLGGQVVHKGPHDGLPSSVFKQSCVGCHSDGAANGGGLEFTADGKVLSKHDPKAVAKALLEGKTSSGKPFGEHMQKAVVDKLTAEQKSALKEFVAGTAKPRTPTPPPPKPTSSDDEKQGEEVAKNLGAGKAFSPKHLAETLAGAGAKDLAILNIGPRNTDSDPKVTGSEVVADVEKELLKTAEQKKKDGKKVVLYCGCCSAEECIPLQEASQILKKNNVPFDVVNFKGPLEKEWPQVARAAGLPVLDSSAVTGKVSIASGNLMPTGSEEARGTVTNTPAKNAKVFFFEGEVQAKTKDGTFVPRSIDPGKKRPKTFRTDDEGRLTTEIPPGTYTVFVEGENGTVVHADGAFPKNGKTFSTVTIKPGEPFNFDLVDDRTTH